MTATFKDSKEYEVKNGKLSAFIAQKGRETYETLTFDLTDYEIKLGPV